MTIFTITFNKKQYKQTSSITVNNFLKEINYKIEGLICKINNELSDLSKIINKDVELNILTYEDEEGLEVFKHSSAHVLGYAIELTYPGSKISSGPPTEMGFYYDVLLPENIIFNEKSYIEIQKNINKILKSKIQFEPKIYTKEELKNIFKLNKYKLYYINRMKEEKSTIYKLENFIDFCKGPHLLNTSYIKELIITNHGGSYFLGEANNDKLTRIYGISFPKKGMLQKYKENIELSKQRNHRNLGKSLDLFLFHEYSPGSSFFLPKGTYIYNKLINLIKNEYKKRGFLEVITPNIFSTKIWKTSGHLENYKENIFMVENPEKNITTSINYKDDFALKPMNCPGHCLMFNMQSLSYKNLPLRYADFGVLHRNELSGTLTGLTRVRRFCQDDAHIFCTKKQLKLEIQNCLEFMNFINKLFGFKYELFLSTRPEKYMGSLNDWNLAEDELKSALLNYKYKLNPGDGAFYGPKIDILLTDSLGKKHQCSTIQLDFQLPKNFNLNFINQNGEKERPVMIHRAILGSIERFMAILLENFGKNLPFWISPNQIALINFSASEDYIKKLLIEFNDFQIKYFNSNDKSNKKIRLAIEKGYRVIIVVGKIEEEKEKIKIYKIDKEFEIKELKEILLNQLKEKNLELNF